MCIAQIRMFVENSVCVCCLFFVLGDMRKAKINEKTKLYGHRILVQMQRVQRVQPPQQVVQEQRQQRKIAKDPRKMWQWLPYL